MARASSTRPQRFQLRPSRSLSALLLAALLLLLSTPTFAVGEKPGGAPPRPPGMAGDATFAHPKLQFQVHSQTKDTTALALSAGWNLVSLPLEPYDPAIGSVLASIAGSFDQVWVYDGCDPAEPWRFYDPVDAAASDLTSLDHRLGFWIHLTTDATLSLDGDPPLNTTTPICSGWNLIGHPRNGPLPVAGALVSIAASVDRVFGFEPGAGAAGWRFWSGDTPSWVHDLDQLAPGRGYWVLANADATYVAADPEPPPSIDSLDLLEGQEITAPTTISATIGSTAEVAWSLAHRPEGTNEWTVFASGNGPAVTAELDPTLLLNGIYEVRLDVADVFGQSTTAEGNVQVAGAMKPGVVTLSFADLSVSMAGLPITVLRTYDSRDKSVGDFGYGWRLELAKGTYRNNRPPGEGWILTGSETGNPQTPCYSSVETLGHFTDVRLSDQDSYRFAITYDAYGFESVVNGGCSGDARFVQIGGRPGASLDIQGNTEVFYAGQTTQLLDATTLELYDPQRVLLTTPEGLEYVLDRDDGVIQVGDPAGQTLVFADNGIHHSDGRSVFFDRDGEGRIRYLVDPAGRTVSYTYDDAGDLVAVTDVLSETLQFEYHPEIPHHLERILDAEGQVAQQLVYDAEGRMVLNCAADGSCVETDHDLVANTETIWDGVGRATTLVYDDWGNVVSQTDALGNTTSFTYDAYGRVTSTTDALGGVATMTYDERGNLISVVEPHDPGEDPADHTLTQTFDTQNRMTALDLPSGGGFRFSYGSGSDALEIADHEGNVLVAYGVDGAGRTVSETSPFGTDQYVLDSQGNPVQHTDPYGRVSTLGYDSLNRLTHVVEADGSVSTLAYDEAGRQTRATFGDGIEVDFGYTSVAGDFWSEASGPTVGDVARHYDSRGRLVGYGLANGGTVAFDQDPSGRMLQETDAEGRTTQFDYDSAGRLIRTTDPRGAVRESTLDALGRVVSTTDPLGNVSQVTYTADGRVASQTDALGRTWTYDATPSELVNTDPLGRETRIALSPLGLAETWTYPDGSQSSVEYLLTSALVGADEFPTRQVDEGGRTRELAYDNLGRLTSATDDSGAVTTFGYADDLLVSWTGPTGASRSFAYDERENPVTVVLEDGGVVERGYGDDNRMAWETRPSGTTWTYDYDAAGRQTHRQASDGSFVERTWSLGDQITSLVDPTGTTQYDYDAAGDLAGIDFPDGSSVTYVRDLLGRATSVTVEAPGITPLVTLYGYDAVGNLASVTDPLGGVTSWTYDAVDRPVQRVLPNGITSEWTYDLRDRVLSVVHRDSGGAVLASATYERAAGGEPTRVTNADGSRVDFAYDSGLRLVSESHFDPAGGLEETITYTYDAAGNRTARSDAAGVASYGYDTGHRLTSVTGASSESYGWDADGRRTSTSRDGVSHALSFDASDRLTSVSEDGQPLVSYTHDGAGRRVAASGPSGDRRFVVAPTVGEGFDSPHLVTDGAGALAAAWVWGGFEPLMRFGPDGPVYYLTDAMGSVIGLADAAGDSAASFRYDGFGNLRSATGPAAGAPSALAGDLRFHGAWLEEATGLYHLRAREYDPRTGLFLSRDPVDGQLEQPETLHPYLFVEGNPQLYTDPTGLFTLIEINISINIQTNARLVNTAVINHLRRFAREKIGEIVSNLLLDFVSKMLPWNPKIAGISNARNKGAQGLYFGNVGGEMLCSAFDKSGFMRYVKLEVKVAPNGDPKSDGLKCGQPEPKFSWKWPRPDFLISKYPPTTLAKGVRKSWLIGDFKISGANIRTRKRQFRSIMNHARYYEYMPVAMYIVWRKPTPGKTTNLMNHHLRKGIILYIMALKG